MVRLTLISVPLLGIAIILYYLLPEEVITPSLPFLIIYFYLITLGVHWIIVNATRRSPRQFVTWFMGATFLKFFIYIITVFAYAFFNRGDLVPFVISFFLLYIIYTVFEVTSVVGKSTE
jgi:hypothetical protein